MPEVNQVSNLLPTGNGGQIPPDIRMKMLAAQLAEQSAAAPKAPYTSRTAGLVSALTGGLGGFMEGAATHDLIARQQAHQNLLADMIEKFPSPGSAPGAAPAGQGSSSAPSSAPVSGDARDLAIRTIYGEAGGESPQGQAGVAAVLKNRLASGQYGKDMSSVITAPKQFSLWNAGDPAGDTARKLDPSSPAYQKIGSIYDGVMSGQISDPTGGADHYYNPKAASPAWGPQLAQQNDVTIGNHRFVGRAALPIGQQASADPSSTAAPGPDASIRDHLMAAAGQPTPSADTPAPNAVPTGSETLPPGLTPDMIRPDSSIRDNLLATAGQGASPSPQPAGSFSAPSAADPTLSPLPAAAPSPSPDPSQGDDLRSTIIAAGQPQPTTPSSIAGSNLQGAAALSPNVWRSLGHGTRRP